MRIIIVLVSDENQSHRRAGDDLRAGMGVRVDAQSPSSDRRSVVTAFYPLAYAAEVIGGPPVSVENLTPPGAEPHDIELTPRQVGHLQQAQLVLYLSHGFQPAVEQAIGAASGKKLDALAGLSLKAGVGDEAGKTDPHVWLDPLLFARIVTRIGAALGQPRRAAVLAARVRRARHASIGAGSRIAGDGSS